MNKTPLTILVCVGILALTGALIFFLKATAPEAKKKVFIDKVPVVEVFTAQQGDIDLKLASEGLVSPRRETVLTAEVPGRIIEVDPRFEVGGEFKAGEIILRLDEVNYRSAVAQAKSVVADARLELEQEIARGEQSARDWKKIGGGGVPSDMVLRIPFLKSAKARVVSAEALLEKALEDLNRTSIRAPFNCRVREAALDLGSTVMTGARLGMVYDTEGYEVRLPFSLTDYALIPTESTMSVVNEIGRKNYQWNAEIVRREGDLDRATLSAYVIAAIQPNSEAPEGFKQPLPGMFVKAEVSGAVLENVIAVPRSAVRGRDQIAIMNNEDQLEFRMLKITRSSPEQVYATEGVKSGERIILTKLELPVVGMRLALAKTQESSSPSEEKVK